MVSIGGEMYHVITRGDTRYFISNEFIGGVDADKDTDDVLTQMSDFVMELKKNRNHKAIAEWFVKQGVKNEL